MSDIRAPAPRPYSPAATAADDPAAILFTSGSTGPPKGVVYTHGIFNAQVRSLSESYGMSPGGVDLATFPLFGLFDPALGITAVIPQMDPTRPAHADPRRIIAAIVDNDVTQMFASPALLDRIGRFAAAHNVKLPSIRRVISAGAPVHETVLRRFVGGLDDDAEVYTPYGATEALPLTRIESREILGPATELTTAGRGVCVGRPVAGVEVRVIQIDDGPIPDWSQVRECPLGEVGEIAVSGPVVTREYFSDPSAAALHKIRDGDRLWHRMGDLGCVDEASRVWLCGRKSQRVRAAQGDMYTVPWEAIFNSHPKVYRTALVGVGAPGAQRPILVVEVDEGHRSTDRDELKRELMALAQQHDMTRPISTILFHPSLPVDIRHNAKINRERLAEWAASRLP